MDSTPFDRVNRQHVPTGLNLSVLQSPFVPHGFLSVSVPVHSPFGPYGDRHDSLC